MRRINSNLVYGEEPFSKRENLYSLIHSDKYITLESTNNIEHGVGSMRIDFSASPSTIISINPKIPPRQAEEVIIEKTIKKNMKIAEKAVL